SSEENKLPRIDVLNLLSEYAGAKDWQEFVQLKKAEGVRPFKKKKKSNVLLLVLVLIAVVVIFISYRMNLDSKMKCSFCFVDADLGEAIVANNLELILLKDDESPVVFEANKSGCVEFEAQENKITAIIKADYYHTDTIVRQIEGEHSEEYKLRVDDYALMIHLFSNSKTEGWQKRRAQLEDIISEDARIYQVYSQNQRGMEIFNKTEFIDKLTMPLQSLNNIRVLETKYKDSKISAMRFVQNNINKK
ncbi:MAG: hypothetical protein IH946_02190, partial [Bacteroidetes bacterium]|nr:hypothetical protein [Bacteroidota bacterium]